MSKDIRNIILACSLFSLVGCHSYAPAWQMRQAQLRTYEMYHARQRLSGELAQTQEMANQLALEKQQAEQSLAVANQRLQNLAQERTKLNDQVKHLLTTLPAPNNPLSGSANRRFEDLARRYPEFEFDPATGVSKFNGDLLFATGSDQIQPGGHRILKEFAQIMNSGDAQQFNILVVGHTDDQPVVKSATKARHETNWDLSAHRATAVVKSLSKTGLAEPRMGLAGYSKFQPKLPNTNDGARQQNRRVEIFILAPDAAIAGRDASTPR
ncbi:OmpA family protein [Thalassoglobus sp.]|uniref:OmpA/MotB family protein n=1 Tax=Thalassoglobus sp. TaxID=2795869 RepID=UPI003AA847ED